MLRQSNSLMLSLAACVIMLALLAGCGGNAAQATPVVPAATNTVAVPTTPAETATSLPTEEATAPVEVSTPTAEATATTQAATETPETAQETPTPTMEPVGEGTPSIHPSDAKHVIELRAREAVGVLKNRDMAGLAALVHPEKGLGFAPYTYIDETNQTLTREEVAAALTEEAPRHWGTFDGTGDDIDMTFEEYYDRFVYNHDFATAPNISYNEFKGHGNMFNNIFEVYPNAIAVEYHYPGFDPQFEGMDWNALYLVFEKHTDGNWYLVHIAHGQWTI